jgi:hypothetical protein
MNISCDPAGIGGEASRAFARSPPDEFAKFRLDGFVQESSERSIELVDRDQFDDIGEVLVRPPQVAEPAGELRLTRDGRSYSRHFVGEETSLLRFQRRY